MADYQYAVGRLEMTKVKRQTRYCQMVDHQWVIGDWSEINGIFDLCGYCDLYFKHYRKKVNERRYIERVDLFFYNRENVPFDKVHVKGTDETMWVLFSCGKEYEAFESHKGYYCFN